MQPNWKKKNKEQQKQKTKNPKLDKKWLENGGGGGERGVSFLRFFPFVFFPLSVC